MHHKLISSRLIKKGFSREDSTSKSPATGGYPSDDNTESNMTTVEKDHVPLSSGLSHVVRMELGTNPTAAAANEAFARMYQGPSSQAFPAGMLHPLNSPLNQALNSMVLEQEALSLEKQKLLIVQQLQLAMQRQPELESTDNFRNLIAQHTSSGAFARNGGVDKPKEKTMTERAWGSAAGVTEDFQSLKQGLLGKRKDSSASLGSSSSDLKRKRTHSDELIKLATKPQRPRTGSAVKEEKEKQDGSDASNCDGDEDLRFRRYQNEQWTDKFKELLAFKEANGHCQVPHTYPANPQLARWVKRQRYQFKLKSDGKSSTMTDERVELLQNAGFVWDSHAVAWLEKYSELKKFAQKNGHCNLTSTNQQHPQLGTWVKCQRRQYKLLREGKVSNMTNERASLLEKIGFKWGIRK